MLNKTDKGRRELTPGQRSLGQRERAILLMADGRQPVSALAKLFDGEGERLIHALLTSGHLFHPDAAKSRKKAGGIDPVRHGPSGAAAPKMHGEQFVGARSLASARMFLFDLSERLFAPRNRALAEHFREALRQARDGATMMRVGRDMIAQVEKMAGSERADGISERLAKLLPETLLEHEPSTRVKAPGQAPH
jgi:hypothetical protein